MISQVFTQDTFKILTVFSLSPGSRFRRKDLQERAVMNNVPLDKALGRLSASGMVKKESSYYAINFESEHAEAFIAICAKQHRQLKQLPLKVYFVLSDIVFQLSLLKGIELYLFGSYSKLIFTEKSDVDIAFLTTKQTKSGIISKSIEKIAKAYSKNVEIHFFDKKAFYSNKKDPLIGEIIRNGMRLI